MQADEEPGPGSASIEMSGSTRIGVGPSSASFRSASEDGTTDAWYHGWL